MKVNLRHLRVFLAVAEHGSVTRAAALGFVSQPAVTALLGGHEEQPLHRLTRREREIFDLLIRGHSNEEIGGRLFIARRTVETHRQRIMKKLATHSILDLIRVAAQQGALTK